MYTTRALDLEHRNVCSAAIISINYTYVYHIKWSVVNKVNCTT